MKGKMNGIQKLLEIIAFVVIVFSVVFKVIVGANDKGIIIALAILAVMMWCIFFVCAFIPADWRLTDKRKAEIQDMAAYQCKYCTILAIANVVISVSMAACIIFVG